MVGVCFHHDKFASRNILSKLLIIVCLDLILVLLVLGVKFPTLVEIGGSRQLKRQVLKCDCVVSALLTSEMLPINYGINLINMLEHQLNDCDGFVVVGHNGLVNSEC